MIHHQLALLFVLVLGEFAVAAPKAPPEPVAPPPAGWVILKGQVEPGPIIAAHRSLPVELRTTEAFATPVEMIFRVHVTPGSRAVFSASDDVVDAAEVKPDPKAKVKPAKAAPAVPAILACSLFMAEVAPSTAPAILVSAKASGNAMAADPISVRANRHKHTGSLPYQWRFGHVKNLWDDADRNEIGSDYETLEPLDQKTIAVRLVILAHSRQIWIDDRLVAEEHGDVPPKVRFEMNLFKGSQVLSAENKPAREFGHFLPLDLGDYSHLKAREGQNGDAADVVEVTFAGKSVPVLLPKSAAIDVDLGKSLYRYRRTKGAGPDAGYVNATVSWPDAFHVDPASLTFRVPYRDYQNAWLLAWVDEKPNTVPAGVFRFFRETAGYPAATDFIVGEEAVREGKAVKLEQKTSTGKSLYLVQVPVNTGDFYGFRDLQENYLEFELCKPVSLIRSYPDPIYYGYHPGGLPSSIHVVGITLEEASFGYAVKPKQFGHIFERPETAEHTVSITSHSDKPIDAKVTLQTRSFDGVEKSTASATTMVAPGKTADVSLALDLDRNGWHELKIIVEASNERRENTLSLVMLPKNTRTYGYASNETRFGIWSLLGHYTPERWVEPGHTDANAPVLEMLRKIGMRRVDLHPGFFDAATLKKYDFLPKAPHTIVKLLFALNENDPAQMKEAIEKELNQVEHQKDFPNTSYLYGGEWGISHEVQYSPWPLYTGDGDRDLTDAEKKAVTRHIKIWSAIGRAMREKFPQAKLYMQWGSPLGTQAYIRGGMPRDLVDGFGMDEPEFELLPEVSNVAGSINNLWGLRQEIKRMGWPNLPIHWVEGPFFPTNPGALTEDDQAEYQIRYWLLGMCYGIDDFQAGVVPYDAGNYYGAEHYGAGVFHRIPLENPKPAVAAIATATSMLCGADPAGPIDTGSLTAYCMSFDKVKDGNKQKIYAMWRVRGTCDAFLKLDGTPASKPMVTDSMGNSRTLVPRDGEVFVTLTSTPIWITGINIKEISLSRPRYDDAPSSITRPLAKMTTETWAYDGSEDKAYAQNHFAIRRIPDPKLTAEFNAGEAGHEDAAAITLPVEPSDRPLANRYGALKLKTSVTIPGKASALGLWVKGNSSWGRLIFQLRDAKGEIWTSNGTRDDWNCDDTHAWSYVNFDGWRYIRFPLPGNHPYDTTRDLENTWWGSRGGDGVVDLPLTLEKIIVEARNEVPVLGEMKLVKERSYKLSNLVAEYVSESDTTEAVVVASRIRQTIPTWSGPKENPIARLTSEGVGTAPIIKAFTEPGTFNDGRTMIIHFDPAPMGELKYNLYVSLFEDGRGADLLRAGVSDNQAVRGFKPGLPVYVFLTAVKDKKESKPSPAFKLVTEDHFAEK